MPRAVQRMVTAAAEYVVPRAAIIIVRALDRDVIGQAHQPRGAAGSVNGWMFAHRPSNRQRNRWAVSLVNAPVDQIPPALDGPFDAILAVNSLAFWPAPVERLAELRRRLAPGGRAAIVSQPRCHGATAGTSRSAADETENLLRTAGFTQMSTETLPLSPPVICVLATATGPDAGHTPQT